MPLQFTIHCPELLIWPHLITRKLENAILTCVCNMQKWKNQMYFTNITNDYQNIYDPTPILSILIFRMG